MFPASGRWETKNLVLMDQLRAQKYAQVVYFLETKLDLINYNIYRLHCINLLASSDPFELVSLAP